MKIWRSLFALALGAENYGGLRYRFAPANARAWGGPMNGQGGRIRMVAETILKTAPVAIVETGTHRGTTTEWLAAFQLPIYTCEASRLNFGFARARLKPVKNVTMLQMDSRAALRHLINNLLKDRLDQTILFYLDAHGDAHDLPLAEELDIVFDAAPRAVVVIDDFQVPDDPGYTYDNYGPGMVLTAEYISGNVARHGLSCFYPRTRSDTESGTRRGVIVLAKDAALTSALDNVSLLRRPP